jgi:hypothetical protein
MKSFLVAICMELYGPLILNFWECSSIFRSQIAKQEWRWIYSTVKFAVNYGEIPHSLEFDWKEPLGS